jgi:hypothetical protein
MGPFGPQSLISNEPAQFGCPALGYMIVSLLVDGASCRYPVDESLDRVALVSHRRAGVDHA